MFNSIQADILEIDNNSKGKIIYKVKTIFPMKGIY